MWIDFSNDKKAVTKPPVKKSDIELETDIHLPLDAQNNTYVIQNIISGRCSAELVDDNEKNVVIPSPLSDTYNITAKCIQELEQDIENGNSEIHDSNENKNTENLTSTARRRRSSSIFIETLRRLVCLHER